MSAVSSGVDNLAPDWKSSQFARTPRESSAILRSAAPTSTEVSAPAVMADYLAEFIGSPHTYTAYRTDLADFFNFCRTRGLDPLTATRPDVAGYLHWLHNGRRSATTVARRLVALRGFYQLAVLDYGLTASPTDRIRFRRPRSQSRLPALTLTELHAFLTAADTRNPRTAGLAWLLATTGLRITEACTARVQDLCDRDHEPWLDVTCKGNLRRSVPLHTATWQRLLPLIDRPTGPIFATRTGASWDRRAASRTLLKVSADAGIAAPFSPHVLRHTFVTLARATGCTLEDVQQAAGHADPATTRSYDRTLATHAAHPAHRILRALEQPIEQTQSNGETDRERSGAR